jgi:hypothetical protein
MSILKEPSVEDPVVFLKDFFQKKEFRPTKRRFKPPAKIVYKEKRVAKDNILHQYQSLEEPATSSMNNFQMRDQVFTSIYNTIDFK